MLKFKHKDKVLIPLNDFTLNEIAKLQGDIHLDFVKDKRSIQQNKYLWKCFQIIGDSLGYTKDEMKALLLIELKFYNEILNKKTGEIVKMIKPTHSLSRKDFSELTESILRFANEYGIVILSPEDYFQT